MNDIYNDYRWSQDLRTYLHELCLILRVPYHVPKEYVPHRWLSILEVLDDNMKMLDAFFVIYSCFIPNYLQNAYKDIVNPIKEKASESGRKRIREIDLLLKKKMRTLTKEGKMRKERIVEKLHFKMNHTLLHLHLYMDILPMFKSCILVLEQKVPLVHRLHDEHITLVTHFLGCFMKHEELHSLSGPQIKKLNLDDKNLLLPLNQVYTGGHKTHKLIANLDAKHANRSQQIQYAVEGLPMMELPVLRENSDGQKFVKSLQKAYIESAKYIIKKLPLDNRVLRHMSITDPAVIGDSEAAFYLKKLPSHFPTILTEDELDVYMTEASRLQLDRSLPPRTDKAGTDRRLDHWWTDIFVSGKYPMLSKIMKAVLSIFCSPHVEQSFSVMNNIITSKSNRTDVSTYSAIQHVKYDLKVEKETTLTKYHRSNKRFSPVDIPLCYHIQTSARRYKVELEKKSKNLDFGQVGQPAKKCQTVHAQAKKITERIKKKTARPVEQAKKITEKKKKVRPVAKK